MIYLHYFFFYKHHYQHLYPCWSYKSVNCVMCFGLRGSSGILRESCFCVVVVHWVIYVYKRASLFKTSFVKFVTNGVIWGINCWPMIPLCTSYRIPLERFHKICYLCGCLWNKLYANEAATALIEHLSWIFSSSLSLMWLLWTKLSDNNAAKALKIHLYWIIFIKFFIYVVVYGLNFKPMRQIWTSKGVPLRFFIQFVTNGVI